MDILGAFEGAREAYFRYYDTPFGINNQAVQDERRSLLDNDGTVWRDPLLELRPRYATAGMSLADSIESADAVPELLELAKAGLLQDVDELYTHQHEALVQAVREHCSIAVTAGTGSGKTEAFTLPILAGLAAESVSWGGEPAPENAWWRSFESEFIPQRTGEHGRRAAVRALVVYPMNALVDDQIARLRQALDSQPVRTWMHKHRRGHRFYFGRYTGATPVSGDPSNPHAASTANLRTYLQQTEKRSLRAREKGGDAEFMLPRLDGAEMRSRWDMLADPPDVLVTNFSMLNVMLLRPREDGFFSATRQWLAEEPSAVFRLIVDELHLYRGTAGTETAYLIRNLQHRLGLDTQPERLQILAASASLEKGRDERFLSEFFGVGADSFTVIPGTLADFVSEPSNLSSHAAEFAAAKNLQRPDEITELLERTRSADALRAVLTDQNGRPQAKAVGHLARSLFPNSGNSEARQALRGLLATLRHADRFQSGLPKLRAHLFFRNITGMWACSDPSCPDADRPNDTDPTVGRLFTAPASRCTCGARVLELLYCQTCGDLYLGGYTRISAAANADRTFEFSLLADLPELDKVPEQVRIGRNAANYVVYWPRAVAPVLEKQSWTRKGANFAFKPSRYDPATGRLSSSAERATGWSFHTSLPPDSPFRLEELPPFPTQCPGCGDEWELKYLHGEPLRLGEKRLRSPIRTMRTGFEKVNQVLTTELLSQLPDGQRKLIAFSDSRQDAAKLSAGIGLRHYQDLLRLLLTDSVTTQGNPTADLERIRTVYRSGQQADACAREAHQRIQQRYPEELNHLKEIWRGSSDPFAEAAVGSENTLTETASTLPSLDQHADRLETALLRLGLNPGGTAASLQTDSMGSSWTALYRWPVDTEQETAVGPVQIPPAEMTSAQQDLREQIRRSLRSEMLNGLFASAGRDFESLGLGWLCLRTDRAPGSTDVGTGLVRASLRVLAQLRRFNGLRDSAVQPPAALKKFWHAYADCRSTDYDTVRNTVENAWDGAVTEYLIRPEHVALRSPTGQVYECGNCRRSHLHHGAGLCTKCYHPLPDTSKPARKYGSDYYAWRATTGTSRFRLNCAELTGQTDRIDSQSRQARFQDVFLEDSEIPAADAVDLVSVTTTMEAGVDIGPLNAVLLANIPPTRFNYQQRVGRAGRRHSHAALALTICRGRSHDDYYFQNPERITNDPTPEPYVSMDMASVFCRALLSEVLRQAFAGLHNNSPDSASTVMTHNTHGQFGTVADWHRHRAGILRWIKDHEREIRDVGTALQTHTGGDTALIDPMQCVQNLISTIDNAAQEPTGHPDLSQRLAESGLLPIYGFPTRVTYLYTQCPDRTYPWPPAGAIDRSIDIAVSQFAPGSETVRDGHVYQADGIADFQPFGHRPRPDPEPLGKEITVALCRRCSCIDDAPDAVDRGGRCRACGAGREHYGTVAMREPAGFRASQQPRDFDGTFTWIPRTTATRTAADTDALSTTDREWLTVRSAQGSSKEGRRYTINDNIGRLFHFRRTNNRWKGYSAEGTATNTAITAALGTYQHTDMFFLGAQASEDPRRGIRIDLAMHRQPSGFRDEVLGRRAAWYSLAALLRRAAAPYLDVSPTELIAGIHGTPSITAGPIYAFLADTLENGAGYCTRLALPDQIGLFLDHTDGYITNDLECAEHAEKCSASCPDCLREYTNMPQHPLLDWRLGRDLFHILRYRDLPIDTSRQDALLEKWAYDYSPGSQPLPTRYGSLLPYDGPLLDEPTAIAVKHPLESLEAARLNALAAEASARFGTARVVLADQFVLDRTPATFAAELESWAMEQ